MKQIEKMDIPLYTEAGIGMRTMADKIDEIVVALNRLGISFNALQKDHARLIKIVGKKTTKNHRKI